MAAPLPELPRVSAAELRARLVRPEGPPSPRFSDTLRALHKRVRQEIDKVCAHETSVVLMVKKEEFKPLKRSKLPRSWEVSYKPTPVGDTEPLYHTAGRYERALAHAFPGVDLRLSTGYRSLVAVEAALHQGEPLAATQFPPAEEAAAMERSVAELGRVDVPSTRPFLVGRAAEFLSPEEKAWYLTADWSEYGSATYARNHSGVQNLERDGFDGVDY